MEKQKLSVNGYQFAEKESFEKAKKEQEAIIYIKAHTNFNNINQVIKVYKNAIEKKMFSTIIGYEFLKQLRNLILKKGVLEEDEIPEIPIYQEKIASNIVTEQKNAKKYQTLYEAEKSNKTIFKITIIILLFVIIIMFYISGKGKNSVIGDYENRIINQYEEWESELEQRERAVEQKEKELGISSSKDDNKENE